MATARLSTSNKNRDNSSLASLTSIRKQITKLFSMDWKDALEALKKMRYESIKTSCRAAYKELEYVKKSLETTLSVPEDTAQEHADEILEALMELPGHLTNAQKLIDAQITKLEHRLQIGLVKKVEVVEEEEEETENISVSGINSLEDLQSAFAKFSKKMKDAEKRKVKKLTSKVAEKEAFEEDEDFSSKALSVVNRFSAHQKRAPKNEFAESVEGVFHSPVMFQGIFNYSSVKLLSIDVFNLGSGFFIFSELPILFCEAGLSLDDTKKKMAKIADKYYKKNGVRIVIPDSGKFFRDHKSPNIQFQVAIPEDAFRLLSPFKSIEQAGFPWARQQTAVQKPKTNRSELDEFIENSDEMKKLILKAKTNIVLERDLLKRISETEDSLAREQQTLETINDSKKYWHEAKVENLKEKLDNLKDQLRQTRSDIKQMRETKSELTKTLREQFIEGDKKRSKIKRAKR